MICKVDSSLTISHEFEIHSILEFDSNKGCLDCFKIRSPFYEIVGFTHYNSLAYDILAKA